LSSLGADQLRPRTRAIDYSIQKGRVVFSETYQNDENDAVSNQLTDIKREGVFGMERIC
jgi:hypothetical protein